MGVRSIFHVVCFLAYAYICYFDSTIVVGKFLPIPGQFFSRFVWLTVIDLYLQTFYHLAGIFVASGSGRHPIFHFVARTLVGPVGASVVFLFWALYLFDPATLLADENAKKIISITWFNHGIHTLPLLTSLVDHAIWNHGQPCAKKVVAALATFSIAYIIDIHYVHHISGFWAYPILGALPVPLRMLFIAVCVSVFYLMFKIYSFVHVSIHGTEKPRAKAGKSH